MGVALKIIAIAIMAEGRTSNNHLCFIMFFYKKKVKLPYHFFYKWHIFSFCLDEKIRFHLIQTFTGYFIL